MSWGILILFLVAVQRLGELALSHHNAKRQIARGGIESAKWQYPPVVAIHLVWFAGMWIMVWSAPVSWPLIGVFILLQVFRVWMIATLGDRWSHRVIIIPGEPLVTTGPYRYVKHPNYVINVCEFLVLPLALGMPLFAVVLTAIYAIWLSFRIAAENRAHSKIEPAAATGPIEAPS